MRPSLSEIASIIRHVLCDNSLAITADTQFSDLSGWDDMDLVQIVVEVECRFDVQFDLTEIDRLETVGDLLRATVSKHAFAVV